MEIDSFSPQSGRFIKEDSTIINRANILDAGKGTKSVALTGAIEITAPEGHYFWCIVPSIDVAVTAQADVANAINADLTLLTSLPAGIPVYTNLTSITPASGEGILYCMEV